ncbi:hypothetical protein GCM10010174_79170 [Kutzneria viridogrisea]|uniref:Uncharacterized protein n=1 Tax=Kutzneria viridogrisea TaxID=47990 RepID=A0ABR6BCR5_9PSEU|nr:hypothetical protein [Kutzneria viridogrisea]
MAVAITHDLINALGDTLSSWIDLADELGRTLLTLVPKPASGTPTDSPEETR